ncbi:MAG: hypothetical protein ACD_41C00303G0004 [uncultured bacterium]|nr:MAG: hypothetical protein ACD_41C00303G0004 [uncultured bacterium]HBY73753.1 hypothetical protein [Candidatus Kerfeldbacteria bacterium]
MKFPHRHLAVTSLGLAAPLLVLAQNESLNSPFNSGGSQTEPILFIAVIIQALLGIVGAGALLMFVWGGFHMIFSGGVEERIKKGRDTLLWAVIGMAVILSSYAVLNFTFGLFQTASSQ